jgi:DNA-binding beta-propeller fold protein YncE
VRVERHRYLLGAVIAVVFTAAGGSIEAGATSRAPTHADRSSTKAVAPAATASNSRGSFGSALVGSARVRVSPSALAIDTATDTIYTANGNNADGGVIPGGNTVSVIDGRHCQGQDVSGCKGPWPTIRVGSLPSTITVDQVTDTVYVTVDGESGNDTVAVFNGATCNGRVTWGCDQKPARVRVGSFPFGIFADSTNHTVYVANPGATFTGDTISMINSSTCNATDLTGCSTQTPATVAVGSGPGSIDVDQSTHTVYVAENGGVSAFDARTCNATVQSGCGTIGMLNGAQAVSGVTVDSSNETIYTADYSNNTMSAWDARSCNASDLAECAAQKPGIVNVGPPPGFEVAFFLAVDVPLHTVYVVNQQDDDLSAVDTRVCNGRHLAACASLNPPTIHTGEDPEFVAVNTLTQTVYVANQVSNDVSVINASRCNAATSSGCRRPAPSVSVPQVGRLAVDTAVATAYVISGARTVAMIGTRNCNADRLAGCATPPSRVRVGSNPSGLAVDQRTDTVYVADSGSGSSGSVSVINAGTCNAEAETGCASIKRLHVPGGNPDDVAVDSSTDTIYVTTITRSGPNLLSVFNGATCDATNSAGCGQTPATVLVGQSQGGSAGLIIALNQLTNTLYITNPDSSNPTAGAVYVVDGATCDAANTAGCGQTPMTVSVGDDPRGVAVDPTTDTVYVVNHAGGDYQGTVSVINGATCNGSNTSGCGQTPSTVAAGYGAIDVALDASTDTIYVTNLQDTSVSVIIGASCNAMDHTGCGQRPARIAVGRAPYRVAVDEQDGTAYIANLDNTVSVIALHR